MRHNLAGLGFRPRAGLEFAPSARLTQPGESSETPAQMRMRKHVCASLAIAKLAQQRHIRANHAAAARICTRERIWLSSPLRRAAQRVLLLKTRTHTSRGATRMNYRQRARTQWPPLLGCARGARRHALLH